MGWRMKVYVPRNCYFYCLLYGQWNLLVVLSTELSYFIISLPCSFSYDCQFLNCLKNGWVVARKSMLKYRFAPQFWPLTWQISILLYETNIICLKPNICWNILLLSKKPLEWSKSVISKFKIFAWMTLF